MPEHKQSLPILHTNLSGYRNPKPMQPSVLRSAVAAACLIMSTTSGFAIAGTLLQDGNPVKPEPLATYGMQVPTDKALQTVLPPGWTSVLAPTAGMTGKVSWGPTDTWLDVMSRIADRADAGFLVDWNSHRVLVRPVSATIQEGAARQQLRQEASTPVPMLKSGHATVAASPAPISVAAASLAIVQAPVSIAPLSTPVPVISASTAAVPAPPAPQPAPLAVRAPTVNAGPSRSFSDASIRDVVNVIAKNYGLSVTMSAPNIHLPGPVTLTLSDNLSEDIRLLQRALGPVAPLAVTYYKSSRELLIDAGSEASFVAYDSHTVVLEKRGFFARHFGHADTPSTAAAPFVAASAPPVAGTVVIATPSVIPAAAPVAIAQVVTAPPVVIVTAPATVIAPPAVIPPAPVQIAARVVFDVQAGERLSDAIGRFLKTQGWTVSWQSQNDMEASGAMHVEAETIGGVLKQILPRLNLVADLYKSNHVAVIRPESVETQPSGAQ
jgi:hypothetical protein